MQDINAIVNQYKLAKESISEKNNNKAAKEEIKIAINKAALLAKTISNDHPDAEIRKIAKKEYEDFCSYARQYGSILHDVPKTTLDDIFGLEEAKRVIMDYIFLKKNDNLFDIYNINRGLGIMLYGPPGTGKTLFAEAIANALSVPIFVVTPADIFKSYVGESEQRIKDLFNDIYLCKDGAVLFIDECEGILGKRSTSAQRYEVAVANEFLQQMNGFGNEGGKRLIVAATNKPHMIDPAYLRYKRFSRMCYIGMPDSNAIDMFLNRIDNINNKIEFDYNESIKDYIKKSYYLENKYTGADINGIIEQACYLAITEMRESKQNKPIRLRRTHFDRIIPKYRASVTKEMLDEYATFEKMY